MILLDYEIFTKKIENINFNKKLIINTINPHSYCLAKKDTFFNEALKKSDILLPDGIGIVLASLFLNYLKINKIAGYDLFLFLMNKMNNQSGTVFFLGSSESTLNLIKKKCLKEYPKVNVQYFSPPFKKSFSEEDSNLMINNINKHNVNVLFVGMTAPKQEKWVHKYKSNINADVICGVGAVFDFYSGKVKRSKRFWNILGLEWLIRFLQEPRRLFFRNFVSSPKFILELISVKFFNKKLL